MQLCIWIILLVLCGLGGLGIGGYAYRLGLKHGRATSVPFQLIDAHLDHKIHCLGEEPAVARVELEAFLALEEWESQPLMQRVLRSPKHKTPQKERANLPPTAEGEAAVSQH